MRIFWGALRAVSVEALGVLVILWMLSAATGLAIDTAWWTTPPEAAAAASSESADAVLAATTARYDLGANAPVVGEPPRMTARQRFNSLFPSRADETAEPRSVVDRAAYAQQQLDHFSQLYGIASRN